MKSQHNHICNIMGLISMHIQKEQDEKSLFAKKQLVSAKWRGDIYKHQFALMTPNKAL